MRPAASGEFATDNESPNHQGHWWSIRRLRIEGGQSYRGRSAVRPGIGTEDGAIHPDRAAEVSRGHSSSARNEGLNDEKEQ